MVFQQLKMKKQKKTRLEFQLDSNINKMAQETKCSSVDVIYIRFYFQFSWVSFFCTIIGTQTSSEIETRNKLLFFVNTDEWKKKDLLDKSNEQIELASLIGFKFSSNEKKNNNTNRLPFDVNHSCQPEINKQK